MRIRNFAHCCLCSAGGRFSNHWIEFLVWVRNRICQFNVIHSQNVKRNIIILKNEIVIQSTEWYIMYCMRLVLLCVPLWACSLREFQRVRVYQAIFFGFLTGTGFQKLLFRKLCIGFIQLTRGSSGSSE